MINNFKINPLVPNKPPQETTVVVAMSGGVDSSVTSALLHVLGYKVIGVTMQLYSNNNSKKKACCGNIDIYDAKRVAASMGFPHYVLNYEQVFKKEVIDDFISSYERGETPIPCVKCNQTVKFRDLLHTMKNIGGDVLATGHYIRQVEVKGEMQIFSSKDIKKDQSYFLFSVTPDQLKFLRFPLGNFQKSDIRALAEFFNLSIANKPDSQDICFVSETYKKTIFNLKPSTMKKGKIIHINGQVLGEHNGIVNFTVGQRKGLGISSPIPLHVVNLNAEKNEVIVGPLSSLMKNKLYIKDLNWISKNQIPLQGLKVEVKLRSSHPGSPATIFLDNTNSATVLLENSYCVITPGQACVIYNKDRMLGGGWIYNKT
ncbi:tRNA 2-thiouridine(34) synthase MnmA [Candidatus Neoehrlichia procyonis]|uniref:tRNA-specific 2-thiouridylase MnmA n=1 Tax=Candidatus Neoehrlichia procyonis str. RAC413 TaxID=1359163 RepID=A0A0F3NPG6_9RICK|nr:tRNA 2-thiouridine(34) synthase MnmA [Candidatus Neoehrlichia lotoris]KJV69636.1 tRNA (5-methylaminomethyl-2-thiouridylate)-methyltransferase [Candidatus Neoehrlichia lotoris str. RAC413]